MAKREITMATITEDYVSFETAKLLKENEIEIPFGAKDSELQEVTYFIPKGFHAEIDDDKVVIKKGGNPAEWSEEDEEYLNFIIAIMKTMQVKCTENEIKRYSNSQAALYYAKVINWLKSIRPQKHESQSDEHYELEEFAKIVRGNLTGISKAVQELFEAKYLQLTGNKMYRGFKD